MANGLDVGALVVGFPLLLFGGIAALGWLEQRVIRPDEHAAAVTQLLERDAPAEDVEAAAARLFAPIDPLRRA